jgi:hypothetical protein
MPPTRGYPHQLFGFLLLIQSGERLAVKVELVVNLNLKLDAKAMDCRKHRER